MNLLEKVSDICNELPDIVKAILFVSAISIFWAIIF